MKQFPSKCLRVERVILHTKDKHLTNDPYTDPRWICILNIPESTICKHVNKLLETRKMPGAKWQCAGEIMGDVEPCLHRTLQPSCEKNHTAGWLGSGQNLNILIPTSLCSRLCVGAGTYHWFSPIYVVRELSCPLLSTWVDIVSSV